MMRRIWLIVLTFVLTLASINALAVKVWSEGRVIDSDWPSSNASDVYPVPNEVMSNPEMYKYTNGVFVQKTPVAVVYTNVTVVEIPEEVYTLGIMFRASIQNIFGPGSETNENVSLQSVYLYYLLKGTNMTPDELQQATWMKETFTVLCQFRGTNETLTFPFGARAYTNIEVITTQTLE